jgi:putative FmdB family regulatory protein
VPFSTYRCPHCGSFDERHRLGAAPPSVSCPRCGATARRGFSPPLLTPANPEHAARVHAIDRAARSAVEPALVDRLPPAGHQPQWSAGPTPLAGH